MVKARNSLFHTCDCCQPVHDEFTRLIDVVRNVSEEQFQTRRIRLNLNQYVKHGSKHRIV